MQLMPSTVTRLKCGDPLVPAENLACGIRLLRGLLKMYDGDLVYALSGYASGLAAPNEARERRGLPRNLAYIEKVLATRARFLRSGCGG